jgi:hypothetical protein
MAVALDPEARALTTRQRLVVAAVALAILALTALRPTPDVGAADDGSPSPAVAEEPSLNAGR